MAIVREAIASARSQPVASLLSIAVVAGMCVAVVLTTGRTVAAEHAVLAEIDAANTRSIIVRADFDAGLSASLLGRLEAVDGIESVVGLGPIVDARNGAVAGSSKVAVRPAYGQIGAATMVRPPVADFIGDIAFASSHAAQRLGLRDGTGVIVTDDGRELIVARNLDVPDHLRFLEPLVVIPAVPSQPTASDESQLQLAVVIVLAEAPHLVASVEATIRSYIAHLDPGMVAVETSAELAAIRAAVSGELGQHGRSTVLGILAISAALVAVSLLALVMMRRRDFGRRRALGASQSLIAVLLVVQTAVLAVVGALTGIAGAVCALIMTGSPMPSLHFAAALSVAGVMTAMLAAVPPAVIAARRDPLHELRVP